MADLLVVNASESETRVAVIENGQVAELFFEHGEERSVLGNIYKGRVGRVLPGMQAAFVDIGLERAGFLYVTEIYGRGADFDFYELGDEEEPEVDAEGEEDAEARAAPEGGESTAVAVGETDGAGGAGGENGGEPGEPVEPAPAPEPPVDPLVAAAREAISDMEAEEDDDLDDEAEGGAAARGAPAGRIGRKIPRSGKRGGPGFRQKRRRVTEPDVNIGDLVKEGQEVIVQVSKAPISTKGARLTCHVSLPGRYLVFMPTVNHVGVSRRISSDKERRRLRRLIDEMRPEGSGFICRTVAEGVSDAAIRADMKFLINLWNEVGRQKDRVRAPVRLYNDLDVVLRVARDYLAESKAKMIIDSPVEYGRIQRQLGELMPDFAAQVELYTSREPIFDAYGIEAEIENALRKEVALKSGGSIVIEQTEALTVIDVNTGRFVGRRNLEETITRANLEAVKEIVYQLRLRNIGGIIVVDFIDMGRASNRDKVYRALLDALKSDKARTNVLKISELGLVEMTRKRTRDSLGRTLTMPCFYCEGRAFVKKSGTVMNEILREMQRRADELPGLEIQIQCHPDVARFIAEEHGKVVDELEKRYQKKVSLQPNRGFHFEHFELHGKKDTGGGGGGGDRGRGRGAS